ncbi:MAG: hypothetical protein HKN03_08405 [Acidimicrobiales bacterium]|nr:hypothetical protein [Acidimicrobiales bacterium]
MSFPSESGASVGSIPGLPVLARGLHFSRWSAAALLLALLLGLSLALDRDGSLGTDTGGKVATIDAMVERGDWSPTIGYWADDVDPDGVAHPFFGTRRTEAGWVNVTTLPMILVTRFLVGGLGEQALLVVPILGAVLTCLAAGELARFFGALSWRPGFLAAASSSPVVVYGLDFWEHSIGLALMLWATVFFLKSRETSPLHGIALALISGSLFGAAATMRQEALIYGAVTGLVCVFGSSAGRVSQRFLRGGAMAAGALVPLAANAMLERAVIGASARTDRAVGVVSVSGTDLGQRIQEGIVITASPINLVHPLSLAMAGLVAVGVVWTAVALLRSVDVSRPFVLCALIILLVFLRLVVFGPTFIPGMLAAVPAAGLGIGAALYYRQHTLLVLAALPIPLVWATQYAGAAEAQWAGRYILTSGLLLVTIGVGLAVSQRPRVVAGFLAANVAFSLIGIAYVIRRTNEFGEANRSLTELTTDVVVFSDDFLAREAAPLGWDANWLSATDAADRLMVSRILAANEVDEFTFLRHEGEATAEFIGYSPVGSTREVSYGAFVIEDQRYVRASR